MLKLMMSDLNLESTSLSLIHPFLKCPTLKTVEYFPGNMHNKQFFNVWMIFVQILCSVEKTIEYVSFKSWDVNIWSGYQ